MILDKITNDEKKQTEIAYMWLGHLRTIPVRDMNRIMNIFGSAISTFDAMYKDDKVLTGMVDANAIKPETKDEIMRDDVETWFDWNQRKREEKSILCVTPESESYPSRLQELQDKPLCIYYRGDITLAESKNTLGVIGSRRPTYYGRSKTCEFVNELSTRGITVISGMAYGIDACAHDAAIKSQGKTIAVLGGGVDICYPQTNIEIYTEMCEKHLVISEYEPEVAPIGVHFPLRNRIISGLSDGLLVAEAAMRSGTTLTVEYALEQGKTVYGIPGRISDPMSKGVNHLIKQGAMLVDSPTDVVEDIFSESLVKPKKRRRKKIAANKEDLNLPPSEMRIIGFLGNEPTHMDEIIRKNDMKISETIHVLGELVNKNLVECIEKSYYVLK